MENKNKTISLKENTVSSAIQKAEREIRFAMKKGDLVAARKLKMKLKSDLESAGYNWKQDPYAVDLIQEAAKIKEKSKATPKKQNSSKKTIEERKIAILTKKIEEATGKKVIFKEAGYSGQLQKRIDTINASEQGLGGSGFTIKPSIDGAGANIFLTNPKGEGGISLFRGSVKEADIFVQGMFSALRIKNGFVK